MTCNNLFLNLPNTIILLILISLVLISLVLLYTIYLICKLSNVCSNNSNKDDQSLAMMINFHSSSNQTLWPIYANRGSFERSLLKDGTCSPQNQTKVVSTRNDKNAQKLQTKVGYTGIRPKQCTFHFNNEYNIYHCNFAADDQPL